MRQIPLLFFILALTALSASAANTDATLLIEPESFNALDSWQRNKDHIQSSNKPGTAFAGVEIKQPGRYQLWTLSQNFIENGSGKRRFLLKIDGQSAASESGTHGKEGWYWDHVGEMQLDAGVHLLEVEDTARFFGRLDAILLTTTDLDPNARPRNTLNTHRTTVVQPKRTFPGDAEPAPTLDKKAPPIAVISNASADITLVFRSARAADGTPRVWREVSYKLPSGATRTISAGVEPLILLSAPKNTVSFENIFPLWKNDTTVEWRLGTHTLQRRSDFRDAFMSGTPARFVPVSARLSASRDSVHIEYLETPGSKKIEATWSLPLSNSHAARMTVEYKTDDDAWLSFAFASGQSVARDAVSAVQLPPLYQFRRISEGPEMVTSSLTPHPFALIEQNGKDAANRATFGVIADPASLTNNWPTKTNARYGFTLVGPGNDAQPWIFSPILGGENSFVKGGETLRASWWAIASPVAWETAMRDADTQVFSFTDYREPLTASLTEQALNIIDLIADDKAGVWDARLKGPENIESPSTVTHSAPLMYFSAALLTQNENLFTTRALPTLEFLLSRPSAHFAITADNNLYVTKATARLSDKNTFYGSAVWQGIDDLTRGLNPWIDDLMRQPDGRPIRGTGGNDGPDWSGWLALLRQKPDAATLVRVKSNVDSWIPRAFETNPELATPVAVQSFYNVSFYPYWWDLLDLYQLTKDVRYLDAARLGAAQTIAGQWVSPTAKSENLTLYPENKYTSNHIVWWKGPDPFRLGWPAPTKPQQRTTATFDIPEKNVPQWTVSQSGLGLEQPTTYFGACNNGMSNIMLSVWAPNLLRLYGETGDDYWRGFARNSIIGRGANYPGYYLSGYTDIMQSEDYPRTGPDITSLYWHHAPVHLAMLIDYIVTDADVRTRGAIRFPYAKQQGYVWFSSRIYGGKPGRVFDDPASRLVFDRKKFNVDTPKVDYFGAIGEKKFHFVLLNQAQGPAPANITIDRAALNIPADAKPRLMITGAANSTTKPKLTLDAQGRYNLTLPERGIAVLTFTTENSPASPTLPVLRTKPVIADLGKSWGSLRAYRIRSPFGSDSVYIMLTGNPSAGTTARVEIEGTASGPQVDSFPYEFTLPSIPMSKNIRFRLNLTEQGQAVTNTQWFELLGTAL